MRYRFDADAVSWTVLTRWHDAVVRHEGGITVMQITDAGREALVPSLQQHISFTIWAEHGPALTSAIEALTNEVGRRLETMNGAVTDQALTNAAAALGPLRAALYAANHAGDPAFPPFRSVR